MLDMKKFSAFCAILALVLAASCGSRREEAQEIRQHAAALSNIRNPEIVVRKNDRRLFLHSGGEVVRTYRIGLGFSPKGHKHKEGDGRTPEGEYYICCKNPNSRYYLSLGLSYPNEQDAVKGLQDRRITKTQCRRIKNAIHRKSTPPWNTPLGGEIFIHGRGSHRDWTLGCVALGDYDMRELYEAVPVGTPVTILP
jgi:murein L,D-transpeptidase YafK